MNPHLSFRKISGFLVACFVFSFFLPVPLVYANVLGNPGFEEAIGSGTGTNWDSTNGAARVTTATLPAGGFSAVPEGTNALAMTAAANFTFQTFNDVEPGDFVTFTVVAESAIVADGAAGGQARIEFRRVNTANDSDELLLAVNSPLITTTNAPAGGGYIRFTISGVAPGNTQRVSFVLREQGGGGNVVFDNASGEVNPAKFTVTASKTHVKAGDVVTITGKFHNTFGDTFNGVYFQMSNPRGLDFLRNSARVNGQTVTAREGSFIIPIGTVLANERVTTSVQLLVTRAVTPGKQYQIDFFIANNTSQLSERGRVRLIVEEDPIFDQGTLIGKVFNDANRNEKQDKGERGVPWVRLMTEEGIVVITDDEGRYHIPGISPGRHVVKIDAHTLPPGTQFITEESFLVKTTPGIMNKANFAVLLPPSSMPEKFQGDLKVIVTQGLDTSRPTLGIRMEPEVLRAGLGILETNPVFKFTINYPEYVKSWYLEIRDELGREIWTGFGIGTPPNEVVWTGQTESGMLVKPGIYSYRFKVEDKKGRQDWSLLNFFRVFSKADSTDLENADLQIPPVGEFNLFKDGKRSIPLVAKPTIRVQGKTKPENQVLVNNQPITVDAENGMFQTEFYTSPGDKEIVVTAITPAGEMTTDRQVLKIKDSTFFMVALGEEQLGINWAGDDLSAAGSPDVYKNDFYEDGRLSYYLRGKLKGKFLVKSHYDTSDKRSALFTNLDPEDYYPIYGDNSTRDYEAHGPERFFLVVEMDRSFLKWGTYETSFTDTELASYNRTLTGLKGSFETTKSTPYGDPTRGMKVFWSKNQHKADHNEFGATGGSLYYLRNRRVLEGSEKIRVEVRDKIQDMSIESRDLEEGIDYEIDYDEGRILLSRPLSSVSASDTLVSRDIMDGNPVFLIVDYEFDAGPDAFQDQNRGFRGYMQVGNHIRIGGTYVEEKRRNVDYDLRGIDGTMKIGRNSKVTAEYAESLHQQVGQSVSYNGGLSFADVGELHGRQPREKAYLIKGETKPVKNLEASAYLQDVQPGFSNDHLRSQQGYHKYGVMTRYKFHDAFWVRYRFDMTEVSSQLRPMHERGAIAPFEELHSHTFQANYDDGKWLAQAEYLRQSADIPTLNLLPTLASAAQFDHGVAGKLGYRLNDRLLPYVKVQTTFDSVKDNQFGGGLRYEIAKNMFAYIEEMIGNLGDSTFFGFERYHENSSRSYANLHVIDRGIGSKTVGTTIGSSYALSEKSRVYSEREFSTYQGQDGFADIMGYEGTKGENWNFEGKYERRRLDNSRTRLLDITADQSLIRSNASNALSGAVSYAQGKKFRARAFVEFRRDQDSPRLWQWVLRDSVQYEINPDLSFLGKLDYGFSRLLAPDDIPASFVEFSTGFAYRPVAHDKLNALARYTYVRDLANDLQFSTETFQGVETDESAHIISADVAYDLYKYLGTVEKLAYKKGIFRTAFADEAEVYNFLIAHRFNFHVTRKWDVALEYRVLWQGGAADSIRHGSLVEIDREFYDYVRLGLGYNFTDFDDDLRKPSSFNSHGPFVRMTGKF